MKKILLILITILIMTSCKSKKSLFTGTENHYDTVENLFVYQEETNEIVRREIQNKENTFSNPLILKNPYRLAPLTALLVFSTEDETSIKVDLNDRYFSEFEKSKEHLIPIYGMYPGFNNLVVLTDDMGNSKTITIETSEFTKSVPTILQNNNTNPDDIYIISADYDKTLAIDPSGNIIWYYEPNDVEGVVEFLSNGHTLISDPYQGMNGIRINYPSFLEIDLLGKVYKQYIGEYEYHHEAHSIDNGENLLIIGHDDNSPFKQAIVYIASSKTMKTVAKLDFYEIFKNIAPSFTDNLVGGKSFNFVINGVDYDEASKDVIVSIRSFGMLVRANMYTNEIKWIFADPKHLPQEFSEYLLTIADDVTRYPHGNHNPVFLGGNRFSYHNNDVDFLETNLNLSNFSENYSSNVILNIDEVNKTVTTEWSYDWNQNILSRMSGSFESLENGNKLISYGSALYKDENPDNTSLSDFSKTKALMAELNENDEIIWEATYPLVMHNVHKSSFIQNKTYSNYKLEPVEILDGSNISTGNHFDVNANYEKLSNAPKFDKKFTFAVNRAMIEGDISSADEINILFVSESNDGHIFRYKDKNALLPIVNSGKYGVFVNGLVGKQKVYIEVNGDFFDTNLVINFGED